MRSIPLPSNPQSHPLAEFHNFVGRQWQHSDTPLMTPEEALARWRDHQETLTAIREGMADIAAGRTRPARAVLKRLARKYGLSHGAKSVDGLTKTC